MNFTNGLNFISSQRYTTYYVKQILEKQFLLLGPFPQYSVLSLGTGGVLDQSNICVMRKS